LNFDKRKGLRVFLRLEGMEEIVSAATGKRGEAVTTLWESWSQRQRWKN
jgi:hypothetical protein